MAARSVFAKRLAGASPAPEGRRWVYVPYDQLTDRLGPLARDEPGELGIVLVESPWKAARRRYHKQKIALILANQRHFALEQAARGVAVRYVTAQGPYAEALAPVARELGGLVAMEPAERELRVDLAPLVEDGELEYVPHDGWLTTPDDFDASRRGQGWRMDAFYRRVRKRTGILMEGNRPTGGGFSFDKANRRPWPSSPPAPTPPVFEPDEITAEVGALIEERFGAHPGTLDLTRLPATREDAERAWDFALSRCLHDFGPFEDAMSSRSRGLFHTRIAALLNLHRLLPARVVADAERALERGARIESVEGFIRQVLGWREFVRHVHRATDGFRGAAAGGGVLDAGATPAVLDEHEPLPPAYWGKPSGFACLDHVVNAVLEEGWTHHIPRLMVLANIATLLGVEPREITDWFWEAFVDAFDWVVEPNVLGMGTFGTGDVMTTKPYIAGAAYINRMSDYCGGCAFNPREDCPLTHLYWAFLERHRERLADVARMGPQVRSVERRDVDRRAVDMRVFELVRKKLARGAEVRPNEVRKLLEAAPS